MKKNSNLLPGARLQHAKMPFKHSRDAVQSFCSKTKHLDAKRGMGSQHGFTLLEVMVAVVILGLAYVSILQSFSLSMSNIHKVREVRAEIFEENLQLGQMTKFTGGGVSEAEEGEGERTLFIEGHKYQLVTITSTSGEMVTLGLEKIL